MVAKLFTMTKLDRGDIWPPDWLENLEISHLTLSKIFNWLIVLVIANGGQMEQPLIVNGENPHKNKDY